MKKHADRNWGERCRAGGHWGLEMCHGGCESKWLFYQENDRNSEQSPEPKVTRIWHSKDESIISEYLINSPSYGIIRSFVSPGF